MSRKKAAKHSGEPVCIHDVSIYIDCERCEIETSSPSASSNPGAPCHQGLTVLICPNCDGVIPLYYGLGTNIAESDSSSEHN